MSYCQESTVSLWPEGHPDFQVANNIETHVKDEILWIENVQVPALEVFLPSKQNATGKAVVICPGGSYQGLAYDLEGTDIAKSLCAKGIAAFVLKYRLPTSGSSQEGCKIPLQDAQRAMRIVRHNSKTWNIAKSQIGIMGFSAGGHLASTVGTHFDAKESSIFDKVDTLSAKPDFMALIYPVITMKSGYTHEGSRNNLIGETPVKDLIDYYSNEGHVNKNTSPAFIVHASDDSSVNVMNSILFYQALEKAGVAAELHIYPEGGHGFGLAIGQNYLKTWIERFVEWLNQLK